MISSTLLTLLPRRPNHLQSDETLSVIFFGGSPHPSPSHLECPAVSESLQATPRMADEAPEAAPKKVLADPIKRPSGSSGPSEALN